MNFKKIFFLFLILSFFAIPAIIFSACYNPSWIACGKTMNTDGSWSYCGGCPSGMGCYLLGCGPTSSCQSKATDLSISGGMCLTDKLCTPNWFCTPFGSCVNNRQSRSCIDLNGCGVATGKPVETQACSVPVCNSIWSPGEWSECKKDSNGKGSQVRKMTDLSMCAQPYYETKECTVDKVCCLCGYQEILECSGKSMEECVNYNKNISSDCMWDYDNKECVSRFKLSCNARLSNTDLSCDVKKVTPYCNNNKDDLGFLDNTCTTQRMFVESHADSSYCKNFFNNITRCFDCSGKDCNNLNFSFDGCKVANNKAEVLSQVNMLQSRLYLYKPNATVTVTMNEGISCTSIYDARTNKQSDTSQTWTITKDKLKVQYPKCSTLEKNDCLGSGRTSRRNEEITCQVDLNKDSSVAGNTKTLKCCPSPGYCNGPWAWEVNGCSKPIFQEIKSKPSEPSTRIRVKSFSMFAVRSTSNIKPDGIVYVVTPHMNLNKEALIEMDRTSGQSIPWNEEAKVYLTEDENLILNECQKTLLDEQTFEVFPTPICENKQIECKNYITFDSSKFYLEIPKGAVNKQVSLKITKYNLTNCFRDIKDPSSIKKTTIGLFDPKTNLFLLRNSNDTGVANTTVAFGSANSGQLPIVGDWDGDGKTTIGLYDPKSSYFYLRNQNVTGMADQTVPFGAPNAGWKPIAGDWDGNGKTEVGLYDPIASTFYLNAKIIDPFGSESSTFGFGVAKAGWMPIAGDWDGDGTTTVGLFDPKTNLFYLRNENSSGPANITVAFGVANSGQLPIAGDWNNDKKTTIGLFDPKTNLFLLRNSNDTGMADITFGFGVANSGQIPIVGFWEGKQVSLNDKVIDKKLLGVTVKSLTASLADGIWGVLSKIPEYIISKFK